MEKIPSHPPFSSTPIGAILTKTMKALLFAVNTPPKEQKDPTHTANFGVKLKELCDTHQVPCDLIYPNAPNIKHPTDNDYIKAHLRPELK
jgi:hypothetical protein